MRPSSLVPPRILHVFPSFGIGGVPVRMARIFNYLGNEFQHVIVALDANVEAASRLNANAIAEILPLKEVKKHPLAALRTYHKILRDKRPDLLMTYNWGAIEWALVNRLHPTCRHIHHEAGFSTAEADRQLMRRVIFRRLALRRAEKVVVPSQTLMAIAESTWRLPRSKLLLISNGVDVARFARPEIVASHFLDKRPDELIIGTLAPLRPEKNIARLLRAVARLPASLTYRLAIVGEGSERPKLERLAAELGIASRTVFTGNIDRPETVLPLFDLFAISSDTEQMPNTILEATAAGLAIAGTEVGDIKHMVSAENRPFLVPKEDENALSAAIVALLGDRALRQTLGRQNRQHVREHFDQHRMFAEYRALFANESPEPVSESRGGTVGAIAEAPYRTG